MNNKLRMIIRLLFVFIFSFLVLEFIAYPLANGDPIANYAFSHAIVMGEIPYKDFNLISTPLYAFIMSIGLFIFDNYLIFTTQQCLLMTILFYFLFKMYDKKAWFILLSFCLVFFFAFVETYNYLCLFFILLIVCFERKCPDKDYLIGILIGLSILSKHTTGLLLFIPLIIICYKDIRKLFRRVLGIMIPISILLIYLIVTNSLFSFIDLSILGLFDFAGNNTNYHGSYIIQSFVLLIIGLIIVIKNKDKKYNYYLLCVFATCIPLFDTIHFSLLFVAFSILCIDNIVFFDIDNLERVAIIIIIMYTLTYAYCINLKCEAVFTKEMHHFEYMYNLKNDYELNKKTFKYFDKFKDKNHIILSSHTMLYDITRDNKLDYFDVLLYGNHGYNGTKKLIKQIEDKKDLYIIVDMEKYEKSINNKVSQYNLKVVDFVLDNYSLIEEEGIFRVYYKK